MDNDLSRVTDAPEESGDTGHTIRHSFAGRMASLLRDPLSHFLLIAAALFLIWPLISDRVAPPPNQITIAPPQVQRLIAVFYKTHLRMPNADELSALVEAEIRTEIYYREGIALGLDRDDEIIRRRIAQKLQFMTQDVADRQTPTDTDLQQFLDTHKNQFGAEPEFAFSQIYLNPDRHGDKIAQDAERLLIRLNTSDGRIDYAADSDPLPVPNDFELTSVDGIANVFGEAFAKALTELPAGRWVGPIRSGFGAHLIIVRDKREATTPQLSQVRDAVVREWQAARRDEANADTYRDMRAKYVIKVELPPERGGQPNEGAKK